MGYNRILTDKDRQDARYESVIDNMRVFVPEMTGNKIASALIQQAFVLVTTTELLERGKNPMILSAGSYHDTAAELLRFWGWNIYDVDPVINCDLHTFRSRMLNNTYDAVISTSVLEHTQDDAQFLDDVCSLLRPGGYGILTCDFKNDWVMGQPVPYTSNRFYTKYDLLERFPHILAAHKCKLIDEPNYDDKDTFVWDGINYSFATFVFRKNNE